MGRERTRLASGLMLTVLLLAACGPSGGSGGGSSGAAPTKPPASAPASGGASAPAPASAPVASASAPTAPLKVTAAYSAASGAQIVILLAEHAGLFQERGLDVDLTLLSGDRAVQSLVAGQLDFAALPGSQVVNAAAGGASVVAVAQELETVGMAFHGPPTLRSVRDLRGKRLGITTAGTLTDMIARVMAREVGYQVGEDVYLINVGNVEDLVVALSAGAIDAALLSAPASFRARDNGYPEFADAASLGPPARIIHTMLAGRREYLDAQPEASRRFVGAYAAAVRRAREDPATAQAALRKWLRIEDPAMAEAVYQTYVPLLKDPPVPSPESWQALIDVMADIPGISPNVRTTTPQSLIDARFIGS